MVERNAPLDTVFHALADPSRRAMLAALEAGEQSIGELAAPLEMSFAGASKHVKVLEKAGLVARTVRGRTHAIKLEPGPLKRASDWLRHYETFWTGRLGALEAALREEDET